MNEKSAHDIIAKARAALNGDSNDAEHDALFDLVTLFESPQSQKPALTSLERELLEALKTAKEVLHSFYYGKVAWNIYMDSPEGKQINAAIERAEKASAE